MSFLTVAIIQSRSGTGWTIDTTLANLDADTLLKDFVILFGTVVQSNTLFTKLSAVSVRYDGTTIGTTTVQLRRRTPIDPASVISYGERFSSAVWNREVNRVSRRAAEYESFGIGSIGDVTGVPSNSAYDTAWATDTIFAPTRQAVYDSIQTLVTGYVAGDAAIGALIITYAPLASPSLTGVPTAPTPAPTANSTQLQTTAGVRGFLTSAADVKALQNTTYPTAAKTVNDTTLASTAFGHVASVAKKVTNFQWNTAVTNATSSFVVAYTSPSITPRNATTSFLVIASVNIAAPAAYCRLVADATEIAQKYSSATQWITQVLMGVHTPGSAAAFTVKLEHRSTSGTSAINSASLSTASSSMTVIEFENTI